MYAWNRISIHKSLLFDITAKMLILPCTRSRAGLPNTASIPIFTVLRALQLMLVLLYCINAVADSVISLVASSISVISLSLNPLSITIFLSASVALTKKTTSSALALQWNTTLSPSITLKDSGDTNISYIVKRERENKAVKWISVMNYELVIIKKNLIIFTAEFCY